MNSEKFRVEPQELNAENGTEMLGNVKVEPLIKLIGNARVLLHIPRKGAQGAALLRYR